MVLCVDPKVVPGAWALWFDREAASATVDVSDLVCLLYFSVLNPPTFTSPTIVSTGSTSSRTERATASSSRTTSICSLRGSPCTMKTRFPSRTLQLRLRPSNAPVRVGFCFYCFFLSADIFLTASISEIPPIVLPGKATTPALPNKKGSSTTFRPLSRQEPVCRLRQFI